MPECQSYGTTRTIFTWIRWWSYLRFGAKLFLPQFTGKAIHGVGEFWYFNDYYKSATNAQNEWAAVYQNKMSNFIRTGDPNSKITLQLFIRINSEGTAKSVVEYESLIESDLAFPSTW